MWHAEFLTLYCFDLLMPLAWVLQIEQGMREINQSGQQQGSRSLGHLEQTLITQADIEWDRFFTLVYPFSCVQFISLQTYGSISFHVCMLLLLYCYYSCTEQPPLRIMASHRPSKNIHSHKHAPSCDEREWIINCKSLWLGIFQRYCCIC